MKTTLHLLALFAFFPGRIHAADDVVTLTYPGSAKAGDLSCEANAKSWPEKFPGVLDSIRRAKDPAAFRYFSTVPADADGWCEITGVVEVPKTAGQAVFMASVASQLSAQDRCEFDDAELVIVPQE